MSALNSRRGRKVVAAVAGAGLLATAGAAYAGRYELREEWLKHQWADRHYNAAVMDRP